MGQYLPILGMIVLALLFGVISIVMTRLVKPPRPNAAKSSPYECGIVDQTPAPERFPVRFYLVAMIFVIFDIELIFLYPYTMVYRHVGSFGFVAIIEFAIAVFASFVYVIANGALDWGPVRQRRRSELMLESTRTTRSTIRRVGTEGRGEDDSAEVAA
jgi:NADH-quinone oxidoreductase subunit A